MFKDSTSNSGLFNIGLNSIDAIIDTFGDYISTLQPDERIAFIVGLVNNTNIYEEQPKPAVYKPQHGETNNIQSISNMFASFYVSIFTAYKEVDRLEKATILNYNTTILLYSAVLSMIKKVNYKLSAFNIYNKVKAKTNVFLESFLNLDNIDYNFPVQKKHCTIDNNAGAAFLPSISTATSAKRIISNIKVSQTSNGSIGSTVSADGFKHDDMATLFDGDNDTWFEYEKTAPFKIDEPLRFEFIIKLATPQIINFVEFTVHPVAGLFPVVDDILVSTTGNHYTTVFNDSIKTWVDFPTGTSTTSSNGIYSIPMFPVRASYVKVIFKQDKQYIARTATKRVYRQVIAIKEVSLYGNKYAQSGVFVSERIGDFIAYDAVGLLVNNELFNNKLGVVNFSISSDDGMSWIRVSDIEKNSTSIDEVIQVNGDNGVRVMVEMDRLSSAFSSSVKNKNDSVMPYRQISSLPVNAPYSLQIDNEPADDSLSIGIIGVGSVGDDTPGMRIKGLTTRKSEVVLPGVDENGMITVQSSKYGTYPGSVLITDEGVDYSSIVVSSEDGSSVIFVEGVDYVVDRTNGNVIFKDNPSSILVSRTTYGVGQTISLVSSPVDESSIRVYNSSGSLVSSSEYLFDATNNTVVFKQTPSGTSMIKYSSIENKFDTVDLVLVTYSKTIRGVSEEYVFEAPTVFYNNKEGFYKIYVNTVEFVVVPSAMIMDEDNQCKIYYGTNKISFNKDISGSIVDIKIEDEYVVFGKSKPHIAQLDVVGSGNNTGLYCYRINDINEVSRVITAGVNKYLIYDDNVIDVRIYRDDELLIENTDYRIDNNIIYFLSTTTSQLSLKYYTEDRSYVNATYSSEDNTSISIYGSDFSFLSGEIESYIIDESYKLPITVSVGSYGHTYVPQILSGTVVITGNNNVYTETPFIDGLAEFDELTGSDYFYSIDSKKGIIYFNPLIPVGGIDTDVSVQYEYTLFRAGYDIILPISSDMYTSEKRQITFNESFASFVRTGLFNEKEIVVQYNIKDIGQPSLADLEEYYTPILFDYSLILATS